jgi:xanthine dehydrogenase accessory factor
MISQEFLKAVTTALDEGILFALLTITKHPDQNRVGTKTMIYPNGEFLYSTAFSDDFSQKLVEVSMPYLENLKSKTITFSWSDSEIECFVEVFPPSFHLIVAGAGHVSEPVATMGKMLGFHVTVIDDREKFANRQRFSSADKVICQSYLAFFSELKISACTYILLLTRGHQFDVISLRELLRKKEKAAYIGMIGSKRRISGVFEQLKADFSDEAFSNIYAPVGLDIGGQTPAEIAISIMAEIIKVRNHRTGKSLREEIHSYTQLGFQEGEKK